MNKLLPASIAIIASTLPQRLALAGRVIE